MIVEVVYDVVYVFFGSYYFDSYDWFEKYEVGFFGSVLLSYGVGDFECDF